MTLIISFSGGRTSAYMARLILDSELYKSYQKLFVFANTGKENNQTLEFINECDKRWNLNVVWLEAKVNPEKGKGTTFKVVDYNSASRNGEPFAAVNDKYGIPNKSFPHCTRELKEIPIRKYVQSICGKDYKMAIGIRADERQRLNMNRAEKNKWIYPLVFDFPTTKRDIRKFWNSQSFDLQLNDYQGNCDLCWKKSLKKRLQIINDNPKVADWWQEQEEKDEYVFDRDGNTIVELRKKAKDKTFQTSLLDNEVFCSCFSNVQFSI